MREKIGGCRIRRSAVYIHAISEITQKNPTGPILPISILHNLWTKPIELQIPANLKHEITKVRHGGQMGVHQQRDARTV